MIQSLIGGIIVLGLLLGVSVAYLEKAQNKYNREVSAHFITKENLDKMEEYSRARENEIRLNKQTQKRMQDEINELKDKFDKLPTGSAGSIIL